MYTIDPGCGKAFSVWCDMNNASGGGWTVFQRRRDGSVNFFRGWTMYESGFGDVQAEHWLGLKKISCLTGAKPKVELRVELADFAGSHRYAHYSHFTVGNSGTNYTLSVQGYSGTAGDSMIAYHHGRQFSTKDRDNDSHQSEHCAVFFKGAWWYSGCHHSNLNGLYLSGQNNNQGVRWRTFPGHADNYSLRYSEMKLRLSD